MAGMAGMASAGPALRALLPLASLLVLLASSPASAQRFGLGRPGQGGPGPGPGPDPGQYYPPPAAAPAWPAAPGQRPGQPGQPGMPGMMPGPGPGHGPGYPAYGDSDGLGSPCNYDEDCDWMEHTYCRSQQTCECKRGFVPSASRDRCLATVGAPCSTKYDCAGLGAAGECRQGVCDCGGSDVPAPDGTCLKAALRINDQCDEDLQCEGLGLGGGQGGQGRGRTPGSLGQGLSPGLGPHDHWAARPRPSAACVAGKCQCAVGKHANSNKDRCIDNRALHEPCSNNDECYIGEGYQSVITCHMGTCRCRDHYVDMGDGKCTAGADKLETAFTSIIILGFLLQLIL